MSINDQIINLLHDNSINSALEMLDLFKKRVKNNKNNEQYVYLLMDYLLDSGFFNTIPFSIFETDKGINYLTTKYIVRTIINSKENVQIIENLNVLKSLLMNYLTLLKNWQRKTSNCSSQIRDILLCILKRSVIYGLHELD